MKKIVLLLALVLLSACTRQPAKYDEFAQCLTDNNFTMYGTEWCPHCKDQKALFGDSLDLVDYVNCDLKQSVCREAGITGYPTWGTNSSEKLVGGQTLEILAQKSKCELPN